MVKFIRVSKYLYILFPRRDISGNANVIIIRNPKDGKVSFIDSGSVKDPGINLIKRVLNPINPSFRDSKLIITHSHLDHCHASGLFQKTFDSKIYAHERIKIEGKISPRDPDMASHFDEYLESFYPFIKDRLIKNIGYYMYSRLYYGKHYDIIINKKVKTGDIIEVSPFKLEVIYTPGHSPDSIVLYERSKKLLFLGDFIPWTPYPHCSIAHFRKSIRKILDLDVKLVIRGHGYPHKWEIEKKNFLDFLDDMKQAQLRILNCLKKRPMTLEEISRNAYERTHFTHNLFYTILMKMTQFWAIKYIDDLIKRDMIKSSDANLNNKKIYSLK
ncbi:MAG: MBL fold metallo-hydrolase [Candidatus Lokiarchaeota archaeon]|nr:MBL fold metallo-hydrolase [Candidatus Lokiarchaeota archaeon]